MKKQTIIWAITAIFVTAYSLIYFLPKTKTDYQISVHNDTTWLYNNGKLVDRVVDTSWESPLMQAILEDNQ